MKTKSYQDLSNQIWRISHEQYKITRNGDSRMDSRRWSLAQKAWKHYTGNISRLQGYRPFDPGYSCAPACGKEKIRYTRMQYAGY